MESRQPGTVGVLILTEETGGSKYPLYSAELLFKPLAEWMADALSAAGCETLLVISDTAPRLNGAKYRRMETVDRAGAPAALARFLEGCEGAYVVSQNTYFSETALALTKRSAVRGQCELCAGETPLGVYYFGRGTDIAARTAAVLDGRILPDLTLTDGWESGGHECAPVHTPQDLCVLEETLRDRVNQGHMERGVRIHAPETVFISPDAVIGRDAVIYPSVLIKGASDIGEDCVVGPNSVINACTVGDGTEINASQINESTIGRNTHIGPFAYIRPGSVVGDGVKLGDFVEVKKAKIGDGTKVSHLTYIGDAEVGRNVNFGCGTVVVNYDGEKKHLTVVEDGAFIGCNTNLVSPVRVGKNAYTAAGTTVTDDVPEGALAIGRARQENKAKWVEKNRTKKA
ncbi:glucosamine-1-phosphate N-acetyltransferase [Oscillospiraceae bacterium OttesenSCG-928-F05]|nr:glucosamine-1-phosphate N-acetyltransferase [Oscillospiraceae bacterium OttesenSCG-928-F05]